MRAVVSSPLITIPPAMRKHLLDHLKRLDLRFGERIVDVDVHLFAMEAFRGGVDTVCRIEAHLDQPPILGAEGRSADPHLAVLLAAHRLERAVEAVLDRPAAPGRVRHANARTRLRTAGSPGGPEPRAAGAGSSPPQGQALQDAPGCAQPLLPAS